jgi:hypothetical protein
MYTDDAGNQRIVKVKGVLPDGYKICWTRSTVRRKLCHCDGRPLKADEVRSLRTGYDLVYQGYDYTDLVSVESVLFHALETTPTTACQRWTSISHAKRPTCRPAPRLRGEVSTL